ncbi:hypothetical protein DH2020_038046 [Rehmannia glutinosa]|uniref:Cyclic nucleotide-binding domain-containing protein n=1 Tax=Rehmannia glutinosa TaxID=99300 RepID=A0ABR0V113_REHGL
MSIPINSQDSSEYEPNLVGFTGPLRNQRRNPIVPMSGPLYANRNNEFIFQPPPQGALRKKTNEPKIERYPSIAPTENNDWPADDYVGKNEHLLKSGQLGMCNDPYCTTCPMYYNVKGRQRYSRTSEILDAKFHNMLYGDAKGWAKRMCSFLHLYIPGVMNPHTRVVQQWNKFFVISCLFAVFLDPYMYSLGIVLQPSVIVFATPILDNNEGEDFCLFRLAYVAPESRVMGAGDLVDDPKRIARNYLFGYFIIDFFVVLPLPQIIILLILPDSVGASGANYAKNLLRAAILVQYIPRLYRFLPLVAGPSPTGFIFESAWANFVINLLTFVLASHVVGSCWYLFGLQRVNQCFRDACRDSKIKKCMEFLDCGHGDGHERFRLDPTWELWKNNVNATACFGKDGFDFGIYQNAVNLTTHTSIVTRYVYSLFWGFQNFLQALGRRRLEMSLRRRDVEQWMSHRRLPEELRRQVRDSERFNWAATRGVNEEMLMENLPEDLQREIRRHLFKFVKKVRIFQLLDEPIIDAICQRLRTKTYIKGSKTLFRGGLVDKMVFIIRGKMESIGEDLIVVPLSEGDVCGEELLTWCLEHSSVNKDGKRIRIPGHRLLSNRLVRCLTNVEAFVLRAADLEEVTSMNHLTGEDLLLDEFKLHGDIGRNE